MRVTEIREDEEHGLTVTFKLENNDKKTRRTWAKIFMLPRYRETEWVFPRKKRRGSMRRRRGGKNDQRNADKSCGC